MRRFSDPEHGDVEYLRVVHERDYQVKPLVPREFYERHAEPRRPAATTSAQEVDRAL